MFYLRGGENTTIYGQHFGSWEIVTHDGTVMVRLSGGMSFSAATHLCKAMNEDYGRGIRQFQNDPAYYERFKFSNLPSEEE